MPEAPVYMPPIGLSAPVLCPYASLFSPDWILGKNVMQVSGHLCSIVISHDDTRNVSATPGGYSDYQLQDTLSSLLLHNFSSPRYEIGLNLGTPIQQWGSDPEVERSTTAPII
jgi:hypothetical protein